MCFSATASFVSATVLTAIGTASIHKARKTPMLTFACIPFIFAIQQLSEGFVWLSLTNTAFDRWEVLFTYLFLFFAHFIWPVWIPFSLVLAEKDVKRKSMLLVLLAAGVMQAGYFTFRMLSYGCTATIDGYHIKYVFPYPHGLYIISAIFYFLATILPAFISSVRRMAWLGILIIISYIGTFIFYQEYIISVWCYFAAVLSGTIYWILEGLHKISLKSIALRMHLSP